MPAVFKKRYRIIISYCVFEGVVTAWIDAIAEQCWK